MAIKPTQQILIRPVVTEKTIELASKLNQYTFLVKPSAGKIKINEAVSGSFDVKVEKVRIVNVLGKKVRFGKSRRPGQRKNYKKAIVTLKKGDSISVFDIK
ncbi:MAG: 50S ribosomal protein L23 [Candidatus Dojkabacteria bacterium]